jgi:exosortase/archaeosortase family protein
LLQLTGVPAYVAGNTVQIPAGAFEIAGGCSGLHFFIVALAIATLYGEIHGDGFRTRVRLVVLAALIAAATNWLRVYIIVLAGHLTDMQHYLVRVNHYYFGWGVFTVAMIVFFALASRMPIARVPPNTASAGDRPSAVSARHLAAVFLGALAALSLAPAWNALVPAVAASELAEGPLLPQDVSGWSGPHPASGVWNPSYPDSDRSELAEYERAGHRVTAFIAQYASQRQGKELIGYSNSITMGLPDDLRRVVQMQSPHGPLARMDLGPEGSSSVLLYYYRIGPHRMVTGIFAQICFGVASLTSAPMSSIVAVRAACDPDCDTAAADAQDWLGAFDDRRAINTNSH